MIFQILSWKIFATCIDCTFYFRKNKNEILIKAISRKITIQEKSGSLIASNTNKVYCNL